MVLTLKIGTHRVRRILVDTGSSADILYLSTFKHMGCEASQLQRGITPLIDFNGNTLQPRGIAQFKVIFGTHPQTVEVIVDFLVQCSLCIQCDFGAGDFEQNQSNSVIPALKDYVSYKRS